MRRIDVKESETGGPYPFWGPNGVALTHAHADNETRAAEVMAAGKLMHGVGVVSDAAFDALASQSLGKDQADTVISVSRVILGVYAGSLVIGNISVIVDGDLTVGHLVG